MAHLTQSDGFISTPRPVFIRRPESLRVSIGPSGVYLNTLVIGHVHLKSWFYGNVLTGSWAAFTEQDMDRLRSFALSVIFIYIRQSCVIAGTREGNGTSVLGLAARRGTVELNLSDGKLFSGQGKILKMCEPDADTLGFTRLSHRLKNGRSLERTGLWRQLGKAVL